MRGGDTDGYSPCEGPEADRIQKHNIAAEAQTHQYCEVFDQKQVFPQSDQYH